MRSGGSTLRSIAPSVFLPALVFEIGNGAVAPVVALTALDLGASAGTAALVLALLGVGQVLGDVPAARLADRLGDRRAMLLATGVAAACFITCAAARSLVEPGARSGARGRRHSTFYLARQSYLTEVAPLHLRARAMSTLGGSHRIGLFAGPFLGAAAIGLVGMRGAYAVAVLACLAVALLLVTVPDAERPGDRPVAVRGGTTSWRMLRDHRRLFATLGLAVLAVGAVRAARQTVLPLWAEHLGLDAGRTSLVFGIASAVDMALFYPAGLVMDRAGRLAVAVPSMLVLGGAMALLPLTHGVVALTLVAMLMSLGNGIGSGIMMTLGADTAPADGRSRFLAVWRLFGDAGGALGPLVVSVVALAASLAAGVVAIGSVGLLAAAGLARWVPRWSAYATPSAVRAEHARIAARR
ncbi:MFS transporter [Angustibacter aerolatus]|uniref:MFS transporter n=1 Tax=Angustibacter aerolatus TaxID=1162965 RepID=A0ABQ6JGT2_9ACTN|nr:MFS transporter [Angustibacter aerolatus]GMA86117.1 MFS transporter [Angustibacter aerolatus]